VLGHLNSNSMLMKPMWSGEITSGTKPSPFRPGKFFYRSCQENIIRSNFLLLFEETAPFNIEFPRTIIAKQKIEIDFLKGPDTVIYEEKVTRQILSSQYATLLSEMGYNLGR
jgi:hypothetical protein